MTRGPKKTIIMLDGSADGYEQVSMKLMSDALRDPRAKALFEELTDNPDINRRELFATAFAFGVTAAINAMREQKIKTFPQG